MKIASTALILGVAFVLAACSTPPTPTPEQPDESRAVIEGALRRADEMAPHTRSADAKAPAAQMAGGDGLTISYAGEGKTLLRQVAAAHGKEFRVLGPVPHLPLFVIVEVQGVTLEGFLGDVGAQFGQRADVVLTGKSIEVRYRGQ